MLIRTESVQSVVSGGAARRSWPYRLAAAGLVLGAAGLVYAPFAGAAYLAMPGVVPATWFAFVDRYPFRLAFASSLAAFVLGLATGLTGLYVSVAGSSSFAVQESGFLVVAFSLWVLPLLGLGLGTIALVGAHFRPGVPGSALRQDDVEPV